jgi:hypothetical protein
LENVVERVRREREHTKMHSQDLTAKRIRALMPLQLLFPLYPQAVTTQQKKVDISLGELVDEVVCMPAEEYE